MAIHSTSETVRESATMPGFENSLVPVNCNSMICPVSGVVPNFQMCGPLAPGWLTVFSGSWQLAWACNVSKRANSPVKPHGSTTAPPSSSP